MPTEPTQPEQNDPEESVSLPVPGSEFGPSEKLAIWLLLGSAFVVILNETVMGVATAVLMRELAITAAAAQWLTTAYMLTMSIVIPMTGLLIQRFSTRALFIAAMTVFLIGTVIGAVAPGFGVLLIGRVVQAAGTAVMMPLLMTTITTVAPSGKRGQFMGYVSILFSVAPACGPVLSGFVLEWLSWRWLFIIMLPIVVFALVAGTLRMPNVGVHKRARIDALSIVLSGFAFGGIVYGLSAAGSAAVGAPTLAPWIPLSVGIVGLALFVWRQLVLQRTDRALLDLRVLSIRPYLFSVVLFVVSGIALFGALFLIPLYAQTVLHFGPAVTGLIVLPGSLISGILAPIVGRLVDRGAGHRLLIIGATVTAISIWSMMLFDTDTHIWQLFATNIVMNIGLSGIFTPMNTIALGSLPSRLASHGSAMITTTQQLAGAAGTALLVTVMTLVAVNHGGIAAADTPESIVAGLRIAFLVSAIIATCGIVVAWFIREEPAEAPR
ncbi:MAG: MDR family MFS transporter [Leucobacter sp.]